MNKFSYKLYKFMQGRYGVDELYKFLLGVYIFLVIIDLFVNFYPLTIVELLLVIFIFYRVLSKNIYKRSKENQKYLQIKNKFKYKINNIKRRYKDRDTKIYKKCPKCKTTLKLSLPIKRGIKHVTCPKCHKRITMLCLRKEKVEVIVKKKQKA